MSKIYGYDTNIYEITIGNIKEPSIDEQYQSIIRTYQKELDKYKEVIDKIKEYAKANKIIEIIALLEVEEIE